MTNPRGGLGRGLGALIPAGPIPPAAPLPATSAAPDPAAPDPSALDPGQQQVQGARFAEIPLTQIVPNAVQPRQEFDEAALDELVASIQQVGLLQPVVVRQVGPERFELVMGERRWRAAQRAGLTAIPSLVRETADDQMLRDALLENLHRQQLNPLEEAAAYQQLLQEFGATHEELGLRLGRSRPQVTNTIRLLQLPGSVQRRVAAGVLSAGHARALLGLPTAQAQEAMAARVVAEGLSVRGVEEAVAVAPRSPDEPATGPRRPARRQSQPELLELADQLSDRFETRVKVDMGRARGKVTIEFASLQDLQRIVGVMGVAPDS